MKSMEWWRKRLKEWTDLSTEEILQLTKDRAAGRSVVYHVANVRTSEGSNDDENFFISQPIVIKLRLYIGDTIPDFRTVSDFQAKS